MKRISFVSTVVSILIISAIPAKADMYTYNFHNITNNSDIDLGDQLSVTVTDAGNNQVLFTFYNDVGIPSSICDVYLDDNSGTLSSLASIDDGSGVSFDTPANPGNLPGGHTYDFYADFSADSDPPVEHNGIDSASESLGLLFNLNADSTFSDVINALANEDLRIGLHIQAIGCAGDSDSYTNNPPTVTPVPGAVLLAMFGLSIAGMKLRKLT
jgi:hypothetical protein